MLPSEDTKGLDTSCRLVGGEWCRRGFANKRLNCEDPPVYRLREKKKDEKVLTFARTGFVL